MMGIMKSTPNSTSTSLPFFQEKIPLAAQMSFRLRHPNLHFVNSRRDRGLRSTAPKQYAVGKVDVDNLVKFILDAIDTVVFIDDGQICHLSCKNVWDDGDGSTSCSISKLIE